MVFSDLGHDLQEGGGGQGLILVLAAGVVAVTIAERDRAPEVTTGREGELGVPASLEADLRAGLKVQVLR